MSLSKGGLPWPCSNTASSSHALTIPLSYFISLCSSYYNMIDCKFYLFIYCLPDLTKYKFHEDMTLFYSVLYTQCWSKARYVVYGKILIEGMNKCMFLEPPKWKGFSWSSRVSSVKDQTVNIFIFSGHPFDVTTSQLCQCNTKAVIDCMETNECDCVLIRFYLQKSGG